MSWDGILLARLVQNTRVSVAFILFWGVSASLVSLTSAIPCHLFSSFVLRLHFLSSPLSLLHRDFEELLKIGMRGDTNMTRQLGVEERGENDPSLGTRGLM